MRAKPGPGRDRTAQTWAVRESGSGRVVKVITGRGRHQTSGVEGEGSALAEPSDWTVRYLPSAGEGARRQRGVHQGRRCGVVVWSKCRAEAFIPVNLRDRGVLDENGGNRSREIKMSESEKGGGGVVAAGDGDQTSQVTTICRG
jgi:hypothetical protein